MYAIVVDKGQQYRVEKGQFLDLSRRQAEPGQRLELDQVLLLRDGERVVVGQPTVPDARVVTEVIGETRARKVTVFKFKAKVRYRRKQGHRQRYCRVKVTDIISGAGSTPAGDGE